MFKHSLLFIACLLIPTGFLIAAETQVSTDTSFLSSVASPGAYYHVRTGDITTIGPEHYLNRYRDLLGVFSLSKHRLLRQSAQNHADYLALNDRDGSDPHGEDESLSGFTGATPNDRCSATGYGKYCTEIQAYGSGDLYSALDALMMTPFHRVSMVHPGVVDIGCAENGNWKVCNIGMNLSQYWSAPGEMDEPILYPADGQVISTTFYVSETPMPYPEYAYQFIGPTLMYWPAGGPVAPEAEVTLYDLTDERVIETIISVNTANVSASNIIFFNPVEQLALDHEFAVRVRDISGDEAYDTSWTFKTQQSSNIDFPNATASITYDAHVDWVDPDGSDYVLSTLSASTDDLIERLSGSIMLATDHHGEAWYVDPLTRYRYYLKDGPTAYEFLRTFGLGITNVDLEMIPTEDDDTGGGALAESLSGRILLQVEEHGEAWYINPTDLKRYYLADGDEAYRIMRELSLGTLLTWITEVPIGSITIE